ncbi:MAG: hypothetical protein P1U89_19230 [Verrucomicrobiales bacterium]|nr:hypothetical protein [Verrucomicrobiales bacterium]
MEIFFSDIPEEGLALSGKLAPDFFNLTGDDSIKIAGDVEYDLTLYSFDEVVVFSGHVAAPVELQCVTCLDFFPYLADFPSWQSEYDIEEKEVKFDPRESLRDEILLSLPPNPHCDEMLDDRVCPKAELFSEFEHDEDAEEIEAPPEGDDVWGALDQLGNKQ